MVFDDTVNGCQTGIVPMSACAQQHAAQNYYDEVKSVHVCKDTNK